MRILQSRQRRILSKTVFEEIKNISPESDVYLIVPDQFTYDTERMALESLGRESLINVKVMSMSRLARKILSLTEFSHSRFLSEEDRCYIVKYIIRSLKDELSLFAPSMYSDGFADNVVKTIEELAKSAVSPDGIEEMCKNIADKRLNAKLGEIKLLYSRYLGCLGGDVYDSSDILKLASENFSLLAGVEKARFYFDGFYSFDKSDEAFLGAVMKNCLDSTFTLVCDDEEFFSVTKETNDFLLNCAATRGVDVKVQKIDCESEDIPPEISFLCRGITRDSYPPFEGEQAKVNLIEASTPAEEVGVLAATIKRLVMEQKICFSDITVIVADMNIYAPLIDSIFEKCGVPVFLDRSRRIIHTSVLRAVFFLLDACLGHANAGSVLSYAKTGFSGLAEGECDELENYVIKYALSYKALFSPFTKAASPNEEENAAALERLNRIRKILIGDIETFIENVGKADSPAESAQNVFYALKKIGLIDRLASLCETFRNEGRYDYANIYAQIYNKLSDVFSFAGNFSPTGECDTASLVKSLEYAFSKTQLNIIPSYADGVRVGDVLRSRTNGCEYIFFVGANEGSFPDSPAKGGMFTENEKRVLDSLGFKMPTECTYVQEKESFVIYTLFCEAKSGVYVSRSLTGGEAPPSASFFWQRIEKMFPGCVREHNDALEMTVSPAFAAEALCVAASNVKYKVKPAFDENDRAIYAALSKTNETRVLIDEIKAFLSYEYRAVINKKTSYRALVGLPLNTSITRLEQYARCPYKYFLDYVISPRKREEAKLYSYDRGSVLHEIIEKFTDEIMAGRIKTEEAYESECVARAEGIAAEVIDTYQNGLFSDLAERRYVSSVIVSASKKVAREIVSRLRDSRFTVKATECEFAFGKALPPVELNIGESKAYIRGKIDRIDETEINGKTYINIIDYKSGSRTNSQLDLFKLYSGLSLQLPVYAAAGEQSGCKNGSVIYFPIDPAAFKALKTEDLTEKALAEGTKKGFLPEGIILNDENYFAAFTGREEIKNVFPAEDEVFEKIKHRSLKLAQGLAEGISEGKIDAIPFLGAEGAPCSYCDYRSSCAFDEKDEGKPRRYMRKIKREEFSELLEAQDEGSNEK